MKRYGNLWEQITSEENLLKAFQKAQKGKRYERCVLNFTAKLGDNLLKLQKELKSRTYKPGKYQTFEIYEPKKRMISVAPFRDRVVHHAICNIIQPIFEKGFIPTSYANREGFGTHRALRKFTEYARSGRYVLQCDIKQYFPSIDHAHLKGLIRQKLKCQKTLELIDKIIDNSNAQIESTDYFTDDNLFTPFERRKGLPIGNLTSQFFANIYLNGFDHFIKEKLGVKKYLRYVDDFALFHEQREFLQTARLKIELWLSNLRLLIHPIKSQIFETKIGANFVGFRVFHNKIRVRRENLYRARKRLQEMAEMYRKGIIFFEKVTERLRSWIAHLEHGNTWQLRLSIFAKLVFQKKQSVF